LDAAAREHDIAYWKNSDLASRHEADRVLENKSWGRVLANDSSFGEKTAAWLTTNAMKLKRKLGMGVRRTVGKRKRKVVARRGAGVSKPRHRTRRRRTRNARKRRGKKGGSVTIKRRRGGRLTFTQIISKACKAIKGHRNEDDITGAVKKSLKIIKKYKPKTGVPRIVPIPKRGGAISLIPILSAALRYGPAVFEGISSIVSGVKRLKGVRDEYNNSKSGSGISRVHIGKGISFGAYKKGYGIFVG